MKKEIFDEAAKGVVPTNTKHCNKWAVGTFNSWLVERNKRLPSEPVPEDILKSNDATLICKYMRCFVLEARRIDGEPYPPATKHVALLLECLLLSHQHHFLSNKSPLKWHFQLYFQLL